MVKKKILVVDDDPMMCEMLNTSLEFKGFEVSTAENGKEGLESIAFSRPDLVLLDINMPIMDGFEFLSIFRTNDKFSSIPVIVLSANDDSDDIIKALEMGADNYLTKPYDPEIIIWHIKNTFRIATKYQSTNPLTGFSESHRISEFINNLLRKREDFNFIALDINDFKLFNDYHNFEMGDQVLLYSADLLRKYFDKSTDYIGNPNGDDFLIITKSNDYEEKIVKLIEEFDKGIKKFYNEEDLEQGHIEIIDRQGNIQQFPFLSLGIGTVEVNSDSFNTALEVLDVGFEVLSKAKSQVGSAYFKDRRGKSWKKNKELSEIKILLYEANSHHIRTIEHFLRPLGFTLLKCEQSKPFIDTFVSFKPHAVIFDLEYDKLLNTIHKVRDYETVKNLHESYLIAISDKISQTEVLSLIKNGVNNIIATPFDKEKIFHNFMKIFHSFRE